MQDEILRLKKENDICILAHAYQSHDILEVADYVGDSYGLSKQAALAPQKTVLMCGVRFMAETVKILSPDKRVLLSNAQAGCPMAEQMDVELISGVKEKYPDLKVAWYSGASEIDDDFPWHDFDYIKVGPYIHRYGPLDSEGTNQRMLKKIDGKNWEDITYAFYRNKHPERFR